MSWAAEATGAFAPVELTVLRVAIEDASAPSSVASRTTARAIASTPAASLAMNPVPPEMDIPMRSRPSPQPTVPASAERQRPPPLPDPVRKDAAKMISLWSAPTELRSRCESIPGILNAR